MGYFDTEADNQLSMVPTFQYGGDAFADVNNVDYCIKYLNQTLTTYGFPSTVNLQSNDPASVVQTCNCIYALLQQRQRDIDFREVANEQRQRIMSDMTRLEAKVERQDSLLATKERELAALTSKEQKAAVTFKAQLEKLQHERDEFQRLVISMQQVRVQQSHELKKKEKEYARLQERLNQVLTEKKKEAKPGLEIMNLLQKEGRQRGTWNSKKADGDFYKMIVDAYESKKQELMAENTDLRALLRSMQSDMRDFLNAPSGLAKANSVNGSFDVEQPQTPRAGRTDVFDLPFHMARDQIEQSLRAKMASIKERMLQLQEAQKVSKANAEASDRELELEAQLVEARSIITEQDRVATQERAMEQSAIRKMPELEGEDDNLANSNNRLEKEHMLWRNLPSMSPGEVGGTREVSGKKHVWPENQITKPEIVNFGSETSNIHTESEGFSEDVRHHLPKMQVAQSQKSSAESLQELSDNETRSMHSQALQLESGIVSPIDHQKCPLERKTAFLECRYAQVEFFSETPTAGPNGQPVWTEGSSISSSVLHDVAELQSQFTSLETKMHIELELPVLDSLGESMRWYGNRNVSSDLSQGVILSEHFERHVLYSKAQSPTAQSQSSSFSPDCDEHDDDKACSERSRSWSECGSCGPNIGSSLYDFQRNRPEFQFIVDDDCLEENQRIQDQAWDMLAPSSQIRCSERVQLKSWVEPEIEEELGYTHSTNYGLWRKSGSKLWENQRVPCCCFNMSSFFLRKKK